MTLAPAPRLMALDLKADNRVYRTKNGRRVPGVTTVVSGTAETPYFLKRWFYTQGRDGFDPFKKSQVAADLGTVVHARIKAYLQDYAGLDPEGIPAELFSLSWPGYRRFLEWWERSGYLVVDSEKQMVSERLKVGGTLDIVAQATDAILDSVIDLIDIKSGGKYKTKSGQPYRSHREQVAGGYRTIWHELDPRPIRKCLIWRIGNEPGDDGDIHEITDVEECRAAFEAAVPRYYALQNLKDD